jgi:hypothetical protein
MQEPMVNSLNDELPLNLGEDVENATQAERGPRRRQRRWDLDQSRLRDGGRLAARQYRPWPSHRPVKLDVVDCAIHLVRLARREQVSEYSRGILHAP